MVLLADLIISDFPAGTGDRTLVEVGRRTIACEDFNGIIDLSEEIDYARCKPDCTEILLTKRGHVGKVYARDAFGRWHSTRPS